MTTKTVTLSALLKRINRRLAHENQRLCKTRQGGWIQHDFGAFCIKDVLGNVLIRHVDPASLGHDLGVLQPDETLIDPDSAD